ncbi:hypothetical protein PF005_g5435 [Phytophthora fragariae]|uniref:Uncharacterized protein n=1 Tax=Phytophthora fragariae TaxID=53985 RepID=A0A6A3T173_9STRA|nr:hypothetical protein PF003_g20951 [Phytophthora fragariae]KAE8948664.1 hypothetical protein PF009_g1774 [Phytophthora fragariae]KAE9022850.1 hypothetical protein PF011_g4257 [Phytophthora fragariae]KAE9127692.1 hypothetical protein PF007_g5524 [Phytophthora fragariae]KAE9128035.1 hypothetical protein PF010_g4661 [Phytophthora fragariae]
MAVEVMNMIEKLTDVDYRVTFEQLWELIWVLS